MYWRKNKKSNNLANLDKERVFRQKKNKFKWNLTLLPPPQYKNNNLNENLKIAFNFNENVVVFFLFLRIFWIYIFMNFWNKKTLNFWIVGIRVTRRKKGKHFKGKVINKIKWSSIYW